MKRQGVIEQQRVHGREVQRVGSTQVPASAAHRNRPRSRRFKSRGKPQQHAFSRAIFTNDADGHAIRGSHIERVQRGATYFSELNRHFR